MEHREGVAAVVCQGRLKECVGLGRRSVGLGEAAAETRPRWETTTDGRWADDESLLSLKAERSPF